MNDTLLTALIGLGGSLVGAAAALGGTWLQARETRKAQREQWHQEQTYKNFEALRDAYVEWLDAVKKAGEEAARTHAIAGQGAPRPWPEHDQGFAATKVLLLEPDADAQALVRDTVRTFYDAMVVIRDASQPASERTTHYVLVATKFDTTMNWLSSRFTRIPLKTLTKSVAPSTLRNILEPLSKAKREHTGT